MIYLDNAATTEIAPEVLEAMMPYLKGQYGNAGAIYSFGREAAEAVMTAREQTARLFGCAPEQVVFTSGGSEGNNMVVKGLRHKLLESGKTHLILSATEHDSMIKAAESLIKDGFYITYVKPDKNWHITADIVENAIQKDTGLVSIMFANNETGAVNDIGEIGSVCKRHSVLFMSDCVQIAGQYPIRASENGIDFATISAHKFHGPKGVGAVFIRDTKLMPLIDGGADQEFGLRGGTENVPGIVGLGCACDSATQNMYKNTEKVAYLKKLFMSTLEKNLSYGGSRETGVYLNGDLYPSPGKVLNLRIDGVSGDTLVLMLDAMGICISAGSACRSHEDEPSHVLLAHGLTETEARSSVRISFSKFNTGEEAINAAKIMAYCIEALRLPQEVWDGTD